MSPPLAGGFLSTVPTRSLPCEALIKYVYVYTYTGLFQVAGVVISNALPISYIYILLTIAEFSVICVWVISYLHCVFAFIDELFCS